MLEVAPPSGQFTLELAAGRPVVFIAGGIGITPFLAMMEQLAEQEPDREAWLFYGVRRREERVMTAQLSQWAKRPSFHVVTCYSHLDESGEALEEFEAQGFITTDLMGRWLPSSNYEFYVCGPPPMMTMVIDGLLDWEVPRSSIHTEAFTPETVREIATTASAAEDASPREVSFRSTGKAPMDGNLRNHTGTGGGKAGFSFPQDAEPAIAEPALHLCWPDRSPTSRNRRRLWKREAAWSASRCRRKISSSPDAQRRP